MFAALKYSARNTTIPPTAGTLLAPPVDGRRLSAAAYRAVAICGGVLVVGFVFLASRPMLSLRATEPSPGGQVVSSEPSPELLRMLQNWPSFRGAGGDGIGPASLQPKDWDGPSGRA